MQTDFNEFLESIDKWYIYNKIVKEYDLSVNIDKRYFYCAGGECEDYDGIKLFKLLIIDKEYNDVYRFSFNSMWCPEEKKEWLLSVIAQDQIETIIKAKNLQKEKTQLAWNNFLKTFEK